MRYVFPVLFLLFYAASFSQGCTIRLLVHVVDSATNRALPSSDIKIEGINIAAATDKGGDFSFINLCPEHYMITVTNVGFDQVGIHAEVRSDTLINFRLAHGLHLLQNVTVSTIKNGDVGTIATTEMRATALFRQSGQTLGETLKNLPGLNSIQTGPTISKPVIHGLHSNRVLILNNGIRQEGQQWGSEHAPEIDPFIANKISVIKGAASVRYGSDAIVGVILVEPQALAPTKALQGELNLVGGTNGRAMGISGMLECNINNKFLDALNWRVQGTLKRAGNFRAADYFLKNTGAREADFSAALNFKKADYGGEVYYSKFNNKVGIFEGSHVGNVSDLYAAFARPKPITASYFTYEIDRTYQNIKHDLLKASAYYQFRGAGRLEAVFSYQKNLREEYDIDLPYSTDPDVLSRPQISFQIKTHALDLIYHHKPVNNFTGSIGATGSTQGNVFRGIRYLVPNFRNYAAGIYAIEHYTKGKGLVEAGLRYDYKWLKTYQINNTTLVNYSNIKKFNNITATVGGTYKFNGKFSLFANIGTAWRAPSINELYIDGIHLSAASYEKGDSSLVSERSYNATFSAKYESEKLYIEIAPYNSIINGFIYARPNLQPITLISGTYPFFQYTQQNVNLSGLDFELRYQIFKHFSFDDKTTIVRGWNKTIHDYLIFMPADRFSNSIRYEMVDGKKIKNAYLNIENVSVLRQDRVPPNSDYVAPPKGYSIFNANAGFEIPLRTKKISVDLAAYNLTNVAYRDYLNRFRYYADDLGANLVLRLKLSF